MATDSLIGFATGVLVANDPTKSLSDLERSYLLGQAGLGDTAAVSIADLRWAVYARLTLSAADPATGRSAADVEAQTRRSASSNPNKGSMSLADLRREAWGG